MPSVSLISLPESPSRTLNLRVLEREVVIHCRASAEIRQALTIAFGGMHALPANGRDAIAFTVRQTDSGIVLEGDAISILTEDIGDLLFELDKCITLALQRSRTDLLFLHSGAVLAADGRVVVVTAASGSGKSTMTWALLHHGFGYLSDELAPIDLRDLRVHAYPHALCLKGIPPAAFPLPTETLVTNRTRHVPVSASPRTGRLAAIFFVDHRHPPDHPVLRRIAPARTAIHLYANTLNPLAHANDGLDAIAEIAQQVPGYELNSADLGAACAAIQTLLAGC